MTARILIELLLFLFPFAVFLVYRAASRDMKIKDRWPLTRLVIIGAIIAAAALIITPLMEPSQSNECSDSVRYDGNGQVTPAKKIPCLETPLPGSQNLPSQTPTQTPVAPRDTGN